MLAALGVCEVGAVILVDSEAEATFEGADMVAEAEMIALATGQDRMRRGGGQVRVFIKVDGLEGELAEALAAVLVASGVGGDATAAHLGADSAFVGHCVVVGGVGVVGAVR